MNELAMLTSLNPTVLVLLDSAGTLASLTAIPTILSILAQAPVFNTRATILCIPNGSNDRSKLPSHLRTNVGLDGLIVEEGVTDAVLLQNGIVGLVLSNAGEAEEESSGSDLDLDTVLKNVKHYVEKELRDVCKEACGCGWKTASRKRRHTKCQKKGLEKRSQSHKIIDLDSRGASTKPEGETPVGANI